MKSRILDTTAIREPHDNRNWDYRDQIEPPPSYRRATWAFWILAGVFVTAFVAAVVSAR